YRPAVGSGMDRDVGAVDRPDDPGIPGQSLQVARDRRPGRAAGGQADVVASRYPKGAAPPTGAPERKETNADDPGIRVARPEPTRPGPAATAVRAAAVWPATAARLPGARRLPAAWQLPGGARRLQPAAVHHRRHTRHLHGPAARQLAAAGRRLPDRLPD